MAVRSPEGRKAANARHRAYMHKLKAENPAKYERILREKAEYTARRMADPLYRQAVNLRTRLWHIRRKLAR